MAGGAEMIREFLVGLSYKLDVGSEAKMRDSIETMAKQVIKLGAAVETAAASVVAGVAKMAEKAEDLYWSSQRLGSSIQSINAFTYSISQMGGSSKAAQSSLEALASFMRSSPGAGGILSGLGINPAAMKDTVLLTTELEKKFAAFAHQGQYYRAKAYASFMGIDEMTLQAMIRDAGKFGDEYQQMVKAVGLNQQQAGDDATYFMQRLRSLGQALDLVGEKAASNLYRGLGDDLERLRQFILQHSDEIVKAIDGITNVIITLGKMLVQYIGRGLEAGEKLYAWFDKLPPNVKKIIEYLVAMEVGWKAWNAAMSASPTGQIIMLAAALLALYDDYETWKEGGKSLIDWSKWEPAIEKTKAAIKWIVDELGELTKGWSDTEDAGAAFVLFLVGPHFLGAIVHVFRSLPRLVIRGIRTALGELKNGIADMGESMVGEVEGFGPRILGAIEGWGPKLLGFASEWGASFAEKFLGPLGVVLGIMHPSATQTDAQEAATPGFSGRFRSGGPQAQASFTSHVSASMVGSLAHATTGFMNRYMSGAANYLGNRVGLSGVGGIGLAAKTSAMQGVVDFFKSKGWNAAQAAGIAANIYQESSLNPDATGDGGMAYGLGQWHPDRQRDFAQLFGKDIRGSSMEEQLAFYDWELRNSESRAGGNLQRATTPEAAAIAVEGSERPAGWSEANPGPQGAIRSSAAAQIYSATAGAAPLSSASAGGGGAVGGSAITVNQSNNVHIQTDDHGAARKLTNALNRTNSDVVRNLQGLMP